MRLSATPIVQSAFQAQSQRDNIRRMLLAIVEDVRVVLIKLAEQITSLRAATKLTPEIQKQLAQAVRDVYAPLANRLGIGQLKWEMEDYAFRYLQPEEYKRIAQLLHEKRQDRDAYIHNLVESIQVHLKKQNIQADVVGRAKHIYSIWRKMNRKGLDFNDIYDVRAVRILVQDIQDCYACLGVVHSLWQYIRKEFDDYIATPKENGYRSLHTAVIGPEGKGIEVQIRTYQMHKEAELGVAAHWLYKEGLRHDASYHHKLATLRQILDWQEEINEPLRDGSETSEDASFVAEIFDDRVYVFTPRGDVIDLPRGATPLDFAYHIHSEIGHRCRGAKVNGAIVPLTYVLHSGDQIEILDAKEARPSRDWLNPHLGYLRSSRAKAKVYQWFRFQDREHHILSGRELFDSEIRRLGIEKVVIETVAVSLGFKKSEDLLASLGRGDFRMSQVLNALDTQNSPIEEETLLLKKPAEWRGRRDIRVEGVGDLMCHYAKCCKPLPGDAIVGYITLGRGVSIHRQDCVHVLQAGEEREQRFIQVQWGEAIKNTYPVDIGIIAYDRKGLLSDITGILSHERVNVTKVHTNSNDDNTATLYITIEVSNLNALGRVLSRILQLPNVLEAYRVRPGYPKEFP